MLSMIVSVIFGYTKVPKSKIWVTGYNVNVLQGIPQSSTTFNGAI